MLFRRSDKGIIKIDSEAIHTMDGYRQIESTDFEAGGVLLGRILISSDNIVIDKVTIPMPGDKRSRYSFKRGAKKHQQIIDDEWEISKGTCSYIGEWHTHPENYPTPSCIDTYNWKKMLKNKNIHSPHLYFIIVGIKEVRVWEGNKTNLTIKQLTPLL